MKKIILALLISIMSIVMIGCGKTDVPQNDSGSQNSQETQNDNNNSEKEDSSNSETEEDKSNLQVIKPGLSNIRVDAEVNLTTKERRFTVMAYNTNDALVGLTVLRDKTYTGAVIDAVDLFREQFLKDTSTSSRGDLYGSVFEVTSTKEVTIAGRESVRFTATASNQGKWDCHIYGYVFVIDEVPCAVIGLVSSDTQDPDLIAEIDARVDRMAATIRTEE